MVSKIQTSEAIKLLRTTRYDHREDDKAIFLFLSALDCPRSLSIWLLYVNGEHDQLTSLGFDPLHYNTSGKFRDAYTASEFLSKSSFLKLSVSKTDAALTKFREYEALCGETNSRFRNLSVDPLYNGPNVWLLNAVIRKMDSILGDFVPEELIDSAGWGPGVSTLLKGAEVSAFNKFRDERGITRDLYSLVSPWFTTAYPLWTKYATAVSPLDGSCVLQVGNQVVTVPKNSKTDRVIAIEPGFNIWFQKGIGSMIRRRLRRVGIDLNSQETNQRMARESSLDGELATVDFSSASDSISYELVHHLVSNSRWFSLLNASRSKYGTHNDQLIKWNKFSAMGNGFTFELESLIFYATAYAVTEYLQLDTHQISVFGDDVIIPKEAYDLYVSFSAFLGFRVNTKKSFSSGWFRESCGSHFYRGIDCKPIYLKERLSNVQGIFKLANSVRALAHRRNSYCGCDRGLRDCWNHLVRRIPKLLRFGIPLGFGDGGLMMNLDEATPSVTRHISALSHPRPADRGFEGFRFPMVTLLGVNRESEEPAMLITRLWHQSAKCASNDALIGVSLETTAAGNSYTLRGTVRIKISLNVLAHQWYNLGPWS